MRRVFFVAILLVGFAAQLRADAWQEAVHKAEKAVVYIAVGDEGGCTGFVINTKKQYVMSAAHCYNETLWVDRTRAKVIALDTKQDLMVLEVKDMDPEKVALPLASKNPEIRQDVMSVGFGYALERPQFRSTTVSDNAMVTDVGIGGPFVAVSGAYTPGQSGGPVIDINGDVVAIVQRGDNGTLGLGVGAEMINAHLGRFFEFRK